MNNLLPEFARERLCAVTRRQFFGRCATGIGSLALAGAAQAEDARPLGLVFNAALGQQWEEWQIPRVAADPWLSVIVERARTQTIRRIGRRHK